MIDEKTYTQVHIDERLAKRAKEMGFTAAGFCRLAMETLISDGFDDYMLTLKLNLIEESITKLEDEKMILNERINAVDARIAEYKRLHETASNSLKQAKETGKLTDLIQRLNKLIILNHYNESQVATKASDILEQIKEINPDFNLQSQIARLEKILIS